MKSMTVVGNGSTVGWASKPVQITPVSSRTAIASSPAVRVRSETSSHLIAGLTQLLRAFDYATDAGRDVWDFAIELCDLRDAGMTTSDFRWLVSKGFAEHGQETSVYGAPHRCFCRGEGLTFLPTAALVLTSSGAAEVRKLLVPEQLPAQSGSGTGGEGIGLPSPSGRGAGGEGTCDEETATTRLLPSSPVHPSSFILHPSAPRRPPNLKPTWEPRSRELRVGEFLVKKFRVPAGNQELVLSAFQEEGWPAYIDDPLPMKPEIVPKRRLHNVITRLNGSQLASILRFHGNGTGEGIGWQVQSNPSPLARDHDHGYMVPDMVPGERGTG